MAKIVMIDDDPDQVAAMRTLLEAAGHELHAAPNGEEGLALVKRVAPALIILDVMMTRYTEGFHVARMLRDEEPDSPYAAYRHIPIIVCSAIHKTTPHRFGPDEGYLPVDVFLDKTTPADKVLAAIDELLAKSAAGRPSAG